MLQYVLEMPFCTVSLTIFQAWCIRGHRAIRPRSHYESKRVASYFDGHYRIFQRLPWKQFRLLLAQSQI